MKSVVEIGLRNLMPFWLVCDYHGGSRLMRDFIELPFLRRRFSNNYCGSAMEVDNIFNFSTGLGHCSTYTCVNCVQHGRFPGKKLACKFLHELFNANFRVFLRWLILLVKIHATCKYFFTTANMADVKLETDFVEKHLASCFSSRGEKENNLLYAFSYYERHVL